MNMYVSVCAEWENWVQLKTKKGKVKIVKLIVKHCVHAHVGLGFK